MFEKLKLKEDQVITEKNTKDFYIGVKKKRKNKVLDSDYEESKYDDYGGFDADQSAISKVEESDEEFITEELFQKALQATLEQGILKIIHNNLEMKKKKNKSFIGKRKKGLKGKIKSKYGKGKDKSLILKSNKGSARKGGGESVDKKKLKNNYSLNYDDMTQYKPLCPALPSNIPKPLNIADRIRAAKRLNMTRRDMTEQKIVKNIIAHNNPADMQNFEVLYISNKNDPFLPDSLRNNDSRDGFPPLV